MDTIQLGGKMKQCFECETTEDLHEHHVVPRSKGGTKTVTLCHQCHMKAHGRDGKGLNHKELTKEGMKTALAKKRLKNPDYRFGNPNIQQAQKKAIEVVKQQADEHARKHATLITSLYEKLGSYNKVAKELNKLGIKSARGKQWKAQSVRRLIVRLKEISK